MSSQALYTGALKLGRPRTTGTLPTATGDTGERLIEIPQQYVCAAKAWLDDAGQAPCQLKTAASVVFVRDGRDGLETILTYRQGKSPLGTVAFPGGLCTPEDFEPLSWVGPSAASVAAAFQQPDTATARAAVVGAIRESFEEVGILLAGPDAMSTVEGCSTGCDQMAVREAIAGGDKDFTDYLAKRSLTLRADVLRPLARWQSPNYRHQRYDTHYFACPAPVGQVPTLLASKGVWGQWVNAAQLVEQKATSALGDLIGAENTVGKKLEELVNPGTLCILESLAQSSTSVAFLAQKRKVQVNKADIVERDGKYFLRYTVPGKRRGR